MWSLRHYSLVASLLCDMSNPEIVGSSNFYCWNGIYMTSGWKLALLLRKIPWAFFLICILCKLAIRNKGLSKKLNLLLMYWLFLAIFSLISYNNIIDLIFHAQSITCFINIICKWAPKLKKSPKITPINALFAAILSWN